MVRLKKMVLTSPRSAYIAFDRYPSSKGSATHITYMIETLRDVTDQVLLLSIKGTEEFSKQGFVHKEFDEQIPNFLRRATRFSAWTYENLKKEHGLQLVHFRDVWGGMAALELPHMFPVFEINGLPSIELPYRYPFLDKGTLEKIRKIEAKCIKCSGKIIVPSKVIRDYLVGEGVSENKITVITNGAVIPENVSEYPGLPEKYVLYFGALQSWQGVHSLLKSFNYLQDVDDLFLVICSSQPEKQVRPYKKIVSRLKLEDKVVWRFQLEKDDLNSVIKKSLSTVAPLSECTRNITQGCSPLKIFESLANETPVIASYLPVVREIMVHRKEGLLIPPDRPADLARAIRQMVEGPEERAEMGRNGLRRIQENYQWKTKQSELAALYEQCIGLMV